MNRIDSPYYPPRARWFSPVFGLMQAIRRRTGLDRLHLPDEISAFAFIASLLVPGIAFVVRKERLIGRAILLGYGLLALVFIVWLGYPVANIVFGLMLSLGPLAQRRGLFRGSGTLRFHPGVEQGALSDRGQTPGNSPARASPSPGHRLIPGFLQNRSSNRAA